ncbi:NifB/NifX family molybdenum-iron cluster-binding protein [Thermodesulfobacteriota bacterium]
MKIALTTQGSDLDAEMDPRFGRARYILIVDSEDGSVQVMNNADNKGAMGGAGIQAGKALADRKVQVLLTGHCGPNAFRTLEAAGIKVGTSQTGKAKDALARLSSNQVEFAARPNVEGHW